MESWRSQLILPSQPRSIFLSASIQLFGLKSSTCNFENWDRSFERKISIQNFLCTENSEIVTNSCRKKIPNTLLLQTILLIIWYLIGWQSNYASIRQFLHNSKEPCGGARKSNFETDEQTRLLRDFCVISKKNFSQLRPCVLWCRIFFDFRKFVKILWYMRTAQIVGRKVFSTFHHA